MTGIFVRKWLSFERWKSFESLGCIPCNWDELNPQTLAKKGAIRTAWRIKLKGQERKKKDIWIACQVNHVLIGWFCCYWCTTLFNYNRYSCIGAFFDFIEWLKVWFIDLYLYLIFCMSTISRFWICFCFYFFLLFVFSSFLMEGIFF